MGGERTALEALGAKQGGTSLWCETREGDQLWRNPGAIGALCGGRELYGQRWHRSMPQRIWCGDWAGRLGAFWSATVVLCHLGTWPGAGSVHRWGHPHLWVPHGIARSLGRGGAAGYPGTRAALQLICSSAELVCGKKGRWLRSGGGQVGLVSKYNMSQLPCGMCGSRPAWYPSLVASSMLKLQPLLARRGGGEADGNRNGGLCEGKGARNSGPEQWGWNLVSWWQKPHIIEILYNIFGWHSFNCLNVWDDSTTWLIFFRGVEMRISTQTPCLFNFQTPIHVSMPGAGRHAQIENFACNAPKPFKCSEKEHQTSCCCSAKEGFGLGKRFFGLRFFRIGTRTVLCFWALSCSFALS